MDTSTARRAITIVAIIAVGATTLGVLSFVVRGAPFEELFNAWIPHNAPLGILGPLGMALVLRRQPTNRAARFLFASGLAASVHVTCVSIFYGLLDRHPALDAAITAGEPVPGEAFPLSLAVPLFVFGWVWVVSASLAMVWGLPLVPDGRWPRGDWRWIERVGLVGMVLTVAAWGRSVLAIEGQVIIANERGDVGPVWDTVFVVGALLLGAAALGSTAAIVTKLRHAEPAERQRCGR